MSTGLESIIIVLAQSINRYEYQLKEQNMSTISESIMLVKTQMAIT